MIVFVFRIPVWEQTKQEMTNNIMLEGCLVTFILIVQSNGYTIFIGLFKQIFHTNKTDMKLLEYNS